MEEKVKELSDAEVSRPREPSDKDVARPQRELSDAEVSQPQNAPRELSDAEVSQPKTDELKPDMGPLNASIGKDLYTEGVKTAVEVTPNGYWGRLVQAFKNGADRAYGDHDFGISEKDKKWLHDTNSATFKAFTDNFLIPAAALADRTARSPMSIYTAFGDMLVEAGIPRDFVGMPDAFLGSPKPTGMFEVPRLKRPVVEGAGEGKPPPPGPPGAPAMEAAAAEGKPGESGTKATEQRTAGFPEKPEGYSYTEAGPKEVTAESAAAAAEAEVVAPKPSPIEQAVDLGVIGSERPRLSEGTPAEAADAATQPRLAAAAAKADEIKQSEALGHDNPWQQRFDHFVERLNTPDDVKQLIRDAAKENGEFLPARQGDIPLSHVEDLAEAAGVDANTIDRSGVGRNLRNDNEVRIAMRSMLQLTEAVKDAARAVKAEASEENLMKMQEAMLRRDMAVEQVVGHRAEWGRTGNVFQEFMQSMKEEKSVTEFLKSKGRTAEDMSDLAKGLDTLDRSQAARVLSEANKKAPGAFYWTWVNGLISGWLTHTKYVAANTLYTISENGVTPALAAIIGKAKQIAGADVDRVFFGEPMAATWGMISAIPGATIATAKSLYSGQRAILKSEIELHKAALERGEKVNPIIDKAVNQVFGDGRPTMFQNSDVWGKLKVGDVGGAAKDVAGRVLGAPGDAAMGIHTFFKILGERAGLEAEAYRAAVKEGHSPTEAEFWNRRAEIAEKPTEDMYARAQAGAYKGTFMSELGPQAKSFQMMTKKSPVLKWVFPFMHIPINLVKATYEHTPLAFLDSEMRGNILGKNGGIAQDKAIARMVIGSSIMGYFVNAALNDRATGDYPIDPKERDAWKLAGKQPNSFLINNTYVSYNKFGPAGDLANLGANIAQVIHRLRSGDDEAMTQGTFMAANAAARMIVDGVGFQSLANLFEAYHDEKKGAAWMASTAASFIPYSSFLSQTASAQDPYMRETKSFWDGFKFRLPGESFLGVSGRESLLPKRDWLGEPLPNAQYGTLLRQREAINSPLNAEMTRLQIHPGPPPDRIGGVKMDAAMYDRYQAVAGAFTKQALENLVRAPGWNDMPDIMREMAIRSTIKDTRAMAAGAMQAANPKIMMQGVQQIEDHITGKTHTDRPKKAPELTAP